MFHSYGSFGANRLSSDESSDSNEENVDESVTEPSFPLFGNVHERRIYVESGGRSKNPQRKTTKFCDNSIRTAKYTIFNFLPL